MAAAATIEVPLRATGVALIGSAVAILPAVLHDSVLGDTRMAHVVRTTDSATWRLIHVGLVVFGVLGTFGAAGIVAAHHGRLGLVGRWALLAIALGGVAISLVGFLEASAFPSVAREAPHLIEFGGPILGSAVTMALAAPAPLFPLGFALLGWAAMRDDRFPPRADKALLVAAVAFAIGEGLFVPVLGPVSVVALAAALSWWGVLLLRVD